MTKTSSRTSRSRSQSHNRASKIVNGTSARIPQVYRKLKFDSDAALTRSLASVKLSDHNLHTVLDSAHHESRSKAARLARAIVSRRKRLYETEAAVTGLLTWATTPGIKPTERKQIVLEAFRRQNGNVLLVHGVSRLPKEDAREMMKTYFSEGGKMEPVLEWLAIAGKALMERERRRGANGSSGKRSASWFGWVSDAADAVANLASGAVEALTDAVTNLVEAVKSAGKSLVDAVTVAASWALDKIANFVRALIGAGNTVASILEAALSRNVLVKFVQALFKAGRAVGEMLIWAMQKVAGVIQQVVNALLSAGASILQLVSWAVNQVADFLQKVLRAILVAGRSLMQLMSTAIRLAASLLRKVVGALIAIGQTVGDILSSVANSALSIIRTVLEGLIMVGISLVALVAAICRNVIEGFRKGFFQGLIAIGHAVVDILKAALATSGAVLALAFAAILEIFGGHRALTAEEMKQARLIFGWSINLDRVKVAVNSIPADAVNFVNGQRPFTTMYVINFASWAHISIPTIIHELTHVWQAVVAGPVYMVEALHSQIFGRGYEVTEADLDAAAGDIRNLQREQQAVVVERYWRGTYGGETIPFLAKYKPLAQDVYDPKPSRTTIPALRPVPILSGLIRPMRITISPEL